MKMGIQFFFSKVKILNLATIKRRIKKINLTNKKIRYNGKMYSTIEKDDFGLGFVLTTSQRPKDIVTVDYSNEKYGLYKIQDIEKAAILYHQKYRNLIFPLDKIEKNLSLNFLFVFDNDGNFSFDKTALHGTFKNFNLALLNLTDNTNKTVFIVDNNGEITVFKNNKHTLVANNGNIYSKGKKVLTKKEKEFVQTVLDNLNKYGTVQRALTKIFNTYNQ